MADCNLTAPSSPPVQIDVGRYRSRSSPQAPTRAPPALA
jgi:hypothetical protein